MKKITLILILIATFGTKSFAHCPIPQWCPEAPLHQTLCSGQQIEEIEFPSVIGKTLIVTWWTDGTRIHSFEDPPPGIIVSGAASNPLGEREYAWPVSIKGAPTNAGTYHYTVSNTCGVELLHGSITLNAPIPSTPGTITFSPATACTGGTFTASISAVNGATSYNWTTPASMTDDGSDSTTLTITDVGTTTGSLAISVTASNVCGTSAPSTANITVGTVPNTPGTITFSPTTACTGGTFTASIGAVTGATSYNWTTPSNMTDNGSNSTSLSVTNAGSTTGSFEVSVTAIGACGASSASTANITVNAAPTIGSVTPTTDQTTTQNTAFASTLTVDPLPIGTPTPTIQWYSNITDLPSGGSQVSGATGNTFDPPNDVVNTDGVFYYAVATNSCGTATTSNTSGKHIVNDPPPPAPQGCDFVNRDSARILTGGPVTTNTWTIPARAGVAAQTWSDLVVSPQCDKTAYTGGSADNYISNCRNNSTLVGATNAFPGHYFSWCAVMQYADILCPGDWRVPTIEDFQNLYTLMGGTTRNPSTAVDGQSYTSGTNTTNTAANHVPRGGTWGGSRFTGHAGSLSGIDSRYWSSSEYSTTRAFYMDYTTSHVNPQLSIAPSSGFALRCVR
ncbi:MAG: hypothetical protein FWG79_06810 [Bacteroidales bacterium]|nr:hypothetical protein [Bacteroidales bacterium]